MNIYLFSAIIIVIYMVSWFIIAQLIKDNGIVDVGWGLGFVLISWMVWYHYSYPNQILLPLIVTIYGSRLAIHIFIRNKGRGEDWRYANWRKEWGQNALFMAFFKVFMLQGFFMWIIALPLMQAPEGFTESISGLQILGIIIWFIGFSWESIGDYQLLQFKKASKNKDQIMTKGLWAYSRHPNYFGEILIWWGIFCFCLPYSHLIIILSPLSITWLLNKISGVPMLEKKYDDNPAYQEYIKNTNALIPKLF